MALLLSGCGNDPAARDIRAIAESRLGDRGTAPQTPGVAGGVTASEGDAPRLLVRNERQGSAAVMVPIGQNGAFRTWATPDRQTVTLRDGILVATRGLGDDLMSSAGGRRQSAAAAHHDRVYRWLDGNEAERGASVRCTLKEQASEPLVLAGGRVTPARRNEERCTLDGPPIVNLYWSGQGGDLLRSRQWVSDGVGYLTLEPLTP